MRMCPEPKARDGALHSADDEELHDQVLADLDAELEEEMQCLKSGVAPAPPGSPTKSFQKTKSGQRAPQVYQAQVQSADEPQVRHALAVSGASSGGPGGPAPGPARALGLPTGGVPSGELFVDPTFPANASSLGKAASGAVVSGPGGPIVWARPEQFLASTPRLFAAGHGGPAVSPMDIMQGALGDCWFLSALSCLAERPELIRDLFVTGDAELAQGYVGVQMMVDGCPREVVVDTLFPVYEATGQPCYAKAKGDELWVMVLEKAYAKVMGQYGRMNGGEPGDALADLTGAPYYTVPAKGCADPDALWNELLKRQAEGFLFCASVPEVASCDYEATVGIIEGHAYAVLNFQEFQGARLLEIRNPWGNVEWKGAWSDSWSGWTPEARAQLSVHRANDGLFWMALEDFLEYFGNIQFLALRPGWVQQHIEGTFKPDSVAQLFEFSFAEGTETVLTLHQPRGRPVAVRFCVVQKGTDRPCGGTTAVFETSSSTSCEAMLLPGGAYVAMVEALVLDPSLLPAPFVLQSGAPRPVPLSPSSAEYTLGFLLPEYAQKYGSCAKCGVALSENCVTALGKKWHPDCWACAGCERPLVGSFMVKDGRPMCEACTQAGAERCAGCKQPVSGAYLEALGGTWHPECFCCQKCGATIQGSFGVRNNRPLCPSCC